MKILLHLSPLCRSLTETTLQKLQPLERVESADAPDEKKTTKPERKVSLSERILADLSMSQDDVNSQVR